MLLTFGYIGYDIEEEEWRHSDEKYGQRKNEAHQVKY